MMNISIYTDGSANNKTRLGGYAFVVLVGGAEVHRGGSYAEDTTSNRMEMQAVIDGIDWVVENLCITKKTTITITSDSRYTVDGMTMWMWGWARRRFEYCKNGDLWAELHRRCLKTCINVRWKKGHDYDNNYWNWVADNLSNHYREILEEGTLLQNEETELHF